VWREFLIKRGVGRRRGGEKIRYVGKREGGVVGRRRCGKGVGGVLEEEVGICDYKKNGEEERWVVGP
jgi:hypothetical protein